MKNEKNFQKKENIRPKVKIEELEPEQIALLEKLDRDTNDLIAEKNNLMNSYRKIEAYLPKINKYDKNPEVIWAKLKQEEDEDGNLIILNDDEVVEKIMIQADPTIRKEVESLIDDENEDFKEWFYEGKKEDFKEDVSSLRQIIEKISTEDSFYNRRQEYNRAKNQKEKDKIWDQLSSEEKIKIKYKNFIFREFIEGKNASQEKKSKIDFLENLLDKYRSDLKLDNERRGDMIRRTYEQIKKEEKLYQEYLKNSPELFLYEGLSNLSEIKNSVDGGGKILETPYVKAKIDLFKSFGSRPVFVHGELGSGKTEFAKYVSRKFYSQNYLKNIWEKDNPKPEDENELAKWESKRLEAMEPLVVSGHKNIDISVMFGSKEMTAAERIPAEVVAELIQKTVERVKAERKKENLTLSEKEENDIRDIMKEDNRNLVTVKTVLGSFYQAMKDGRPIILDELNAIPHTALIAINDLLTLKPGDIVTPVLPGIKPFSLAEGFKVLATGNWKPEDGKFYFGRQGLDAAFLSRFAIVSYDYLPQRIEGLTETEDLEIEKKEKGENELFYLMISKLLNKDLSLNLPKGSIEKIRALASAARLIQNIFSGKKEGETMFHFRLKNESLALKEILKENVLSIRHLLPILEDWRSEGFIYNLEEYILKNYINRSDIARDSEKIILYNILQTTHGGVLFRPEDGWPEAVGVEGEQAILDLRSEDRIYSYDSLTGRRSSNEIENPEKEFLSNRKVVELLFGKLPKRQEVDSSIFSFQEDKDKLDRESEDLLRDYDFALGDLEKLLSKFGKNNYIFDEKDKEIIEKIEGGGDLNI